MIGGQGSRTAQYVAFFRALETRRPAAERLFADPLAAAFLDRGLGALVAASGWPGLRRLVPWLVDRRAPGPRASAVARTRVIDEALGAAVRAGAEQVLILGAGYDARAYRLAPLRALKVFEVDHPDTQRVKRRVLANVLGGVPDHARFVPVDFEHDDLRTALEGAGLRAGARTFVIWEGVASYLAPASVDATIRCVGTIAGPGSELIMTYVHRGLIDHTVDFPHSAAWVRSVERAGEPFVFGFDPDQLGDYLYERNWELRSDVSTPEALAMHGAAVGRVPSFYRIAHARRADGRSGGEGAS